ncbi:LysE family transporter [Clostridium weizhouense]|uniref:LysE family translocator n=1 Tax=Clostridium weizhouense TaxID=2859781 RepID=A0ABS7ASW9_9CLOT|nr:LysE family transporter [Clostridium weizhouense]MBW6411782.1 LysE family translocator [Clostridium weizhouense]
MLSLFFIFRPILIGFFTGFFASIPLGPSGIESINRSISDGFREGYKVSFGAVSADLLYIIIINLGLFKILNDNQRFEGLFWIVSGFVLILFNIISRKSSNLNKTTNKLNIKSSTNSFLNGHSFLTGFFITFFNPTTPSLWIALSGTILSVWRLKGDIYFTLALSSMFLGSLSWFFVLNLLAIKGFKMLKGDFSNTISKLLDYFLFILGIIFIIWGFIKFIF